jgi:hypothetical protein
VTLTGAGGRACAWLPHIEQQQDLAGELWPEAQPRERTRCSQRPRSALRSGSSESSSYSSGQTAVLRRRLLSVSARPLFPVVITRWLVRSGRRARQVAGAFTRGSAATGVESHSTASQDGAGVASAGDMEHPSNPVDAPTAPRETPPERPPTGPGTPASSRSTNGRSTRTDRSKVLRLETPPEWKREGRREAAQGRYNGRRVRTASAEQKARTAWNAGARTVGGLVEKAGIGRSAASKYRRQFQAEASTNTAAAATAPQASTGQAAQ